MIFYTAVCACGMENNMKKRKIIFCCMLAVVLASLCSCASKKSAKKSEDEATVIIDKDNTVSVTYTEEFKEDYYDKDELEAQVDREIEEFNSSYAEDKANGMSKQSLKLKDKKITLKLKFASYKDYEAYSAHYVSITKNVKLFAGTYEDAVAAGYDLTNKVIDLDKKPEVKLDEKSDNVDCNSPKLTSYLEEMSVRNVEKLLINNRVCSYRRGITRIINKINKPNDNRLTIRTDNHFGNPFSISFFKNGYKAYAMANDIRNGNRMANILSIAPIHKPFTE